MQKECLCATTILSDNLILRVFSHSSRENAFAHEALFHILKTHACTTNIAYSHYDVIL